MASEFLYLKKRANFHRRMARQATCGEARCAHEAFVRAYLDRIEGWISCSRPDRPTKESGTRTSTGPAAPTAARSAPIR